MKREIYRDLLEWKTSTSRKPLMLYGARQVGKTYILKEFGSKEFENMVYINCYKNSTVAEIFEKDADIKRIIRDLSIYTGETIKPFETFLFFDEVQETPDIVGSLKYFCEDAPEIFVATAGSLLGVMDMKGASFPTGNVDIMHLYPMTYAEFLTALGHEEMAALIKEPESMNSLNALSAKYEDILRQYYYVGGMPRVVKEFIESGNLQKVRKLQYGIIEAYEADIAKHAGKDAVKARKVWLSIPQQLAKENKKFVYGALRKGARAAEYENAIQWLIDSGIVYKVNRAKKAAIPLTFYLDNNVFKLFVLDVGILGAMNKTPASEVLIKNNIFSEYKGAFTENYVLSQLVTKQDIVVAYFSKDDSKVEIDFLIQNDDKIIAAEVKAEENVKSKSLRQFVTIDNAGSGIQGLRFSMKGFIDQGWMLNVPLFAVSLL